MEFGRNIEVGNVVEFGSQPGNDWKITELRTASPDGVPYGDLIGYTATYVGKRSRYVRQGHVERGMIKAGGLYYLV